MANNLNSDKAVIFDMDGVLFDTGEFHKQAWYDLAEKEGFDFSQLNTTLNEILSSQIEMNNNIKELSKSSFRMTQDRGPDTSVKEELDSTTMSENMENNT